MTTFTPEQLDHISQLSLTDETVKLLWEEYTRITTSNYKMLLVEVNEMSKVLAEDLRKIRTNSNYSSCVLITNDGDDKGITNIMNVVKQVELFNVNLTGEVMEEKKNGKKSGNNVPEL